MTDYPGTGTPANMDSFHHLVHWHKPRILTRFRKNRSRLEDTNTFSVSAIQFCSILFCSILSHFPASKWNSIRWSRTQKKNPGKHIPNTVWLYWNHVSFRQSCCTLTLQIFKFFNLLQLELCCFATSSCKDNLTKRTISAGRFLSKFNYQFSCTSRVQRKAIHVTGS